MEWRLILDGDLPGAHNMARDMAVLEAVAAGASPPTLRLYGWSPPCLTLGKHQGLDAADLAFCQANGVDVGRRPTGGRALLHHLELTYAVVAPLGCGPLPSRLQEAYRLICSALVAACRSLGVAAELTGGQVNLRLPNPTSTVPCFEAAAEGEVVVAGRKLVGSAMRAHAGCILQHGAILLDWDGRLQAGALGLADDAELRSHVTTLSAELGRAPDRAEVEAAVVRDLAGRLGVELPSGPISGAEAARETVIVSHFSIQTKLGRLP
ncbi:MAG TPA: lipoate--protein ligase family protein [Candidatus Sulfomarinibacteraceae bacterium]|nr:lipoate--protein ligase family protein [Candidatus Sulfomarinibacteraceae bacterium]